MTQSQATPGGRRVLIVEDDTLVGMALKHQVERLGHQVVGHASVAGEATKLFEDEQPDLVLVDVRLDGDDGIELATELFRKRRCPMIVISAYSDQELIERAGAAGVFGYLIKPVSGEALAAQIEVAIRRFDEQERLRQQNEELARSLETRKLVERAKGIFMQRLRLSEQDAHRRLQHEAQRRRITVGDLAKRIIESEEMLGGG